MDQGLFVKALAIRAPIKQRSKQPVFHCSIKFPSAFGEATRERAMERFGRMRTLQKFAAVHGTVHNLFIQERHLISHDLYRQRRSAALAEWRGVVGWSQALLPLLRQFGDELPLD